MNSGDNSQGPFSWKSFSILIRAQQQLRELEGQFLSSGTRAAAHALSHYLGTLTSRKTQEKKINFADRRATARAVDNAVANINAEAAKRQANPGKIQVSGRFPPGLTMTCGTDQGYRSKASELALSPTE